MDDVQEYPHEEEFFDIGIISLLPESLQNDSEVMLSAVKAHATCLRVMQEKWRNDKNVVMVAIGQDGDLLEFVSDELKDEGENSLQHHENEGQDRL